jgi:hypothetical protein
MNALGNEGEMLAIGNWQLARNASIRQTKMIAT